MRILAVSVTSVLRTKLLTVTQKGAWPELGVEERAGRPTFALELGVVPNSLLGFLASFFFLAAGCLWRSSVASRPRIVAGLLQHARTSAEDTLCRCRMGCLSPSARLRAWQSSTTASLVKCRMSR